MAAVWISLLTVCTFVLTISAIVIGQETHPIVGFVLFAGIIYGAIKLFQRRITRI
ncbi:MAG: hypothetical protein IAE64_05140 [Flavobacteriales bacterium]|nr:MAG: hypothetical protein UZ06_CHB003001871 [Chlorobi bacterium OLB6]MBE2265615.1 hypothetical protein [Flavobacteriales bacterium]MBV6463011.1 hypothetical protein [Chlorobiota bacterium]MBZ0194672.1 hypothetical protein [Candidatus Kapabacteria bacterium]MCC6331221.1 hypothetical protein [Ignavibacteria bacterium]